MPLTNEPFLRPYVFLINDWCGKAQPTEWCHPWAGGFGLYETSRLNKPVEGETASNSISPCDLHQVLLWVGALISLRDEPYAVRWNKPFPAKVAFGHSVYRSTRKPTRVDGMWEEWGQEVRRSFLALVRHLEWEKNWRKNLSGCRSPSYGHGEKGPATRELSWVPPFPVALQTAWCLIYTA